MKAGSETENAAAVATETEITDDELLKLADDKIDAEGDDNAPNAAKLEKMREALTVERARKYDYGTPFTAFGLNVVDDRAKLTFETKLSYKDELFANGDDDATILTTAEGILDRFASETEELENAGQSRYPALAELLWYTKLCASDDRVAKVSDWSKWAAGHCKLSTSMVSQLEKCFANGRSRQLLQDGKPWKVAYAIAVASNRASKASGNISRAMLDNAIAIADGATIEHGQQQATLDKIAAALTTVKEGETVKTDPLAELTHKTRLTRDADYNRFHDAIHRGSSFLKANFAEVMETAEVLDANIMVAQQNADCLKSDWLPAIVKDTLNIRRVMAAARQEWDKIKAENDAAKQAAQQKAQSDQEARAIAEYAKIRGK